MILVVAALPQELAGCFQDVPVVYTGVGKVNATYALTKAVSHVRPSLVLNVGTAASKFWDPGTMVECLKFYQRDMDCSLLGFPIGNTPFEESPHPIQTIGRVHSVVGKATCHTGDSFCDPLNGVVDMEAYALAKVCHLEDIPFICLKYISDSGDAAQWQANCANAGPQFRKLYDEIKASLS